MTNRKHRPAWIFALSLVAMLLLVRGARADRIRDLCDVVGVRDNQLLGYGIVTGLNGTGDDITAPLAQQSLLALMRRLGIQVDTGQLRLRNVAAVLVTTNIPPFARTGAHLDVTVSSVGNARSLRGGVLLQTLLAGADMHVYAVAQGPLVIGGFDARGLSGSSVSQNAPNTGRVPGGALVEREIPMTFVQEGNIVFGLHEADFATAERIVAAVDKEIGAGSAMAVDSGAVKVKIPAASKQRTVELVAKLGSLDVTPGASAKVVINERTGTIIAGGDVRLAPAAIAQGGLTIVIKESSAVSQPAAPFSRGGTTAVTPQTEITPIEPPQGPSMTYLDGATSLTDVAQALAALGVKPSDLASILQALRTAGALRAEIVMQ